MFEWLAEEVKKANTPRFYLFDGPANTALRNEIISCPVPLPRSYVDFALEFGNANLYRLGSKYLVRVFASPRTNETEDGDRLFNFGRTDLALAYFKQSLLRPDAETPVLEWKHPNRIRIVAATFNEWLLRKCAAARKRFTRKEWTAIQRGPDPFNDLEQSIVEARKRFTWRIVGVAENGDLLFEVRNNSGRILPFLTVGVRQKGGESIGAVWLPVATILPGETKIIEKDCYKQHHPPTTIEVFEERHPEPADRASYWEFKPLEPN